jgi:DNA-binding PadR family transcriptional regulator
VSLQGALAALLLPGPSYGYVLHATLERELGQLWVTRTSQVYLTLGRMSRDGITDATRVPQPPRPDRQVLRLTPRGRRLAETWLFGASDSDEILVRIAVGRLVVPDRFRDLLETITAERTAALHELRLLRADSPRGFARAAIELEIRRTEADLRWLNSVRTNAKELAVEGAAETEDPGIARPA